MKWEHERAMSPRGWPWPGMSARSVAFEYTVIGDPVNEAARLTELAKEEPGRLLASEAIVAAAAADDWQVGEAVILQGREAQTRLARPGGGPRRHEESV